MYKSFRFIVRRVETVSKNSSSINISVWVINKRCTFSPYSPLMDDPASPLTASKMDDIHSQ